MQWFDFNFLINSATHILTVCMVFSVVVFCHEFGHYFFARLFGVKIEVFSIGLGPEIFSFRDRSLTKWRIAALPLGGYVRMLGDMNIASFATSAASDVDKKIDPQAHDRSFSQASLTQRFIIALAGPLANFLLAILIIFGLLSFYGKPEVLPTVSNLEIGGPGREAGIEVGDVITEINGSAVHSFAEIKKIVAASPGLQLDIKYLRDGSEHHTKATPKSVRIKDGVDIGSLGMIFSDLQYKKLGLFSAFYLAALESYRSAMAICSIFKQMLVSGEIMENIGGPIRIAQETTKYANLGISALLWFVAILSINLGLINLLPLPPLDGGHILYYLLVAVAEPLSARFLKYGLFVGTILVVILLSFTAVNDILVLMRG
ncbi:zinc metalloprotease [Rickettsiales bacterium]|nr:zinc metalloprotease [Rickettsiales bacterium]